MIDPGTLRDALRSTAGPGDYDAAELDVQSIMTRGRRLRTRRRVAAVGGALCVAAAVFGVVTGVSGLSGSSPVPPPRLAPVQHQSTAGRHPGVPAPVPRPAGATPRPSARPSAAATSSAGASSAGASPADQSTAGPAATGSAARTSTPTPAGRPAMTASPGAVTRTPVPTVTHARA